MKRFLLLSLIVALTGCSSDEPENCCVVIDTGVSIKYLTKEGANLLEMEDGYTPSDITVYHRIDNQWVKYFEGNLYEPKGLRIEEREDGKYLKVFVSTNTDAEGYSETKLEFSETDADVIRAAVDKAHNNTIVTKVWYNGQLKWESNQSDRIIEVLKEL